MDIPVPTPEELSQLLAANAHRFPTKATVPVVGDRGGNLSLKIIIGIPTGAARSLDGSKSGGVWKTIVDGGVAGRLDVSTIEDRLLHECLLWPPPRVYAVWRNRWPAVGGDIAWTVCRKMGFSTAALVEPAADAEPPEAIAGALAADPRATWRRLAPHGATFDVAISTPDSVRHDAYIDAIKRRDADTPALVRELAEAQTVACVKGNKGIPPGEMFAEFPGLAILVAGEAKRLGGAIEEIRLGEWT